MCTGTMVAIYTQKYGCLSLKEVLTVHGSYVYILLKLIVSLK